MQFISRAHIVFDSPPWARRAFFAGKNSLRKGYSVVVFSLNLCFRSGIWFICARSVSVSMHRRDKHNLGQHLRIFTNHTKIEKNERISNYASSRDTTESRCLHLCPEPSACHSVRSNAVNSPIIHSVSVRRIPIAIWRQYYFVKRRVVNARIWCDTNRRATRSCHIFFNPTF